MEHHAVFNDPVSVVEETFLQVLVGKCQDVVCSLTL